jgi:hypothetical protein
VKQIKQFMDAMREQKIEYYCKVHENYHTDLDALHWASDEYKRTKRTYNQNHPSAIMVEIAWLTNKDNFKKRLTEMMIKEFDNKLKALVARVEKKGGAILDASYLTIGNDGSLNGLIQCERGKVEVETIFAGGYNIQCLHFRVLVK